MNRETESTLESSTKGVDRTLQVVPGARTVYFAISDGKTEFLNINVDLGELVSAINKIPGVTATYEKPVPSLPTEPGIYVGKRRVSNLNSAKIWKLKSPGSWSDAEGYNVSPEQVQRAANLSGGLVRLVPDE